MRQKIAENVLWILVWVAFFAIMILMAPKHSEASPVYNVAGERLKESLKIETFYNVQEANLYAAKVDGQVFKEQGQELYHVIWGSFKINDVVVMSNYE